MPQIIEVPGFGDVEFPDNMSDEQIASAIKSNMSPMAEHPLSETYSGRNIPQIRQDKSLLSAGTRETISNIARPTLEYGGAGLGATLGTIGGVLGGPPGMAASGLIGSALGYATGKSAANIVDLRLGVPRKELIERVQAPSQVGETIKQTFNDIKYGAELEMGGQIGGTVASKVISKLISPLSKEVTTATGQTTREIPKDIQEIIGLYKEAGIQPSPAELVHGGKTLAIMESVLGYSPFSGDVILKKNMTKLNQLMVRRAELINKSAPDKIIESVGNDIRREARGIISKYATKQADKVDTLVNKFMGQYGSLSKYQSGLKFGEILEADRTSRMEQIRSLYDQVKSSLPEQGRDVIRLSNDITSTAKQLMEAEKSKALSQQDRSVIRLLRDFIPEEVIVPGFTPEQLAKIPALKEATTPFKQMTWEGLDQTRSTLLEKTRNIIKTQGENTKEARIYTILSDKIENEMNKFAIEKGTNTGALMAEARNATRTMHELYDKDMLRIMNKPPEDILKRIVNNGEVTLIHQIRNSTGEAGLEPLRQGFFKQAIETSSKEGVLNPIKLQKVIKTLGDDTLNSLATPEQAKMLKNIVDKGITINSKMTGMKTIQFLETLNGTSNEKIVNTIFKTGNVGNIRLAKRLLSPDRIKEITSEVLANKILKVHGTGNYMPISSMNEFIKHRPELQALLEPNQFAAVNDFMKLGQRMSNVETLAKNSSQTGQVFVGHDALKKVLTAPLSAFKMTFVPYLLAKGYTSPLALKYITSAAKLPPNSPEAINLFIKGFGVFYQENKNEILRDLQPTE